MADELTQEEIEQREELIDVMMEQARSGKKGLELDIERYLQHTKTGKAVTEATKATKTLTGGFKESAKALGTSTGNFTDLTSAVTGTIGAISGLLSNIPVVGKAFAALGDAAAETASFAIGQIQSNYDSFKELAKAGQIGADGVTGMADRFEEAGIPLQTYTKLLGSHSEELAFFSSSALAGGKSFSGMIANMDGDSKQFMRNLGYSIEEIGEAAIDFQVLQRKRGIISDMDSQQLSKGTANYVEELNAMAKLTGQNVKDLQKQRDEVRADSRFRSRLAALRAKGNNDGADEMENFAAMMKKINPEIGKGFMDITSGAINTDAALKLTRSGMLDTAKEIQRGLETGTIDKAQAINMIIATAKEASKAGGMMASLAGLSEEAAAKFFDYASTLDTANMTQKELLAIEKDIAKTKATPDKTTDSLSTTMGELERSIAKVNKFFITSPAAVDMLGKFSGAMEVIITKIEEAFGPAGPSKPSAGNRNLASHQNKGQVNKDKFDITMLQSSYDAKLKQLTDANGDIAKIKEISLELTRINTDIIAKRQNVKKLGGEFDSPTTSTVPVVKATEKMKQATNRVAAVLEPVIAATGPKPASMAKPINRLAIEAKEKELSTKQTEISKRIVDAGYSPSTKDIAETQELIRVMHGVEAQLKKLNDKADTGNKTAADVVKATKQIGR